MWMAPTAWSRQQRRCPRSCRSPRWGSILRATAWRARTGSAWSRCVDFFLPAHAHDKAHRCRGDCSNDDSSIDRSAAALHHTRCSMHACAALLHPLAGSPADACACCRACHTLSCTAPAVGCLLRHVPAAVHAPRSGILHLHMLAAKARVCCCACQNRCTPTAGC